MTKLKRLNQFISEKIQNLTDKPNFLVFYLHRLYPEKKDRIPSNGNISEGITIEQFEQFIVYFKERGYHFLTENDLLDSTKKLPKKSILVTFDDGYFNNFYALDILKKHEAKATFFISTNHIKEEKCYWWDIHFMKSMEKGISQSKISIEFVELYKQNWKEVEDSIKLKYGETVFQSKNDLMRPMNSKELKEFANHDEVSLANHTNNHQNLENYSIQDLESFILEGHDYLKNELDIESKSLAYPYGFYNKNTILATKKLNYKLGYTINEGKNYLYNYNPFEIKRFSLNGYEYMPDICHRALISNS